MAKKLLKKEPNKLTCQSPLVKKVLKTRSGFDSLRVGQKVEWERCRHCDNCQKDTAKLIVKDELKALAF